LKENKNLGRLQEMNKLLAIYDSISCTLFTLYGAGIAQPE
jgi:hypothetical protein